MGNRFISRQADGAQDVFCGLDDHCGDSVSSSEKVARSSGNFSLDILSP
jgi:hypothetical protein